MACSYATLAARADRPLLLLLPVAEMVRDRRGSMLFYGWSLTVTVMITVATRVDGAAASPLFALLFAVPDVGTPGQQAALVGVVFVLASTAYSVFQIPYVALPVELSDTERIRIMAWRMVLLTVGILVAGAVAPALADEILELWLATPFEGGRHEPRIAGIHAIEADPNAS